MKILIFLFNQKQHHQASSCSGNKTIKTVVVLITWKLEYSGFIVSNKLFWLSTIQFYYKVHHLIPRTTIGPLVSLQSCLLWKTYFLFCLQFSWDTSKINLEMTMMGGQGVKTVLASHSQKVPNCVWLMCVQTHWGVCSHYACCRIMNLNFSISMPLVSSLNFPHLWKVHLICLSFKLRNLIVELWKRKEHTSEMRRDSFGKKKRRSGFDV